MLLPGLLVDGSVVDGAEVVDIGVHPVLSVGPGKSSVLLGEEVDGESVEKAEKGRRENRSALFRS